MYTHVWNPKLLGSSTHPECWLRACGDDTRSDEASWALPLLPISSPSQAKVTWSEVLQWSIFGAPTFWVQSRWFTFSLLMQIGGNVKQLDYLIPTQTVMGCCCCCCLDPKKESPGTLVPAFQPGFTFTSKTASFFQQLRVRVYGMNDSERGCPLTSKDDTKQAPIMILCWPISCITFLNTYQTTHWSQVETDLGVSSQGGGWSLDLHLFGGAIVEFLSAAEFLRFLQVSAGGRLDIWWKWWDQYPIEKICLPVRYWKPLLPNILWSTTTWRLAVESWCTVDAVWCSYKLTGCETASQKKTFGSSVWSRLFSHGSWMEGLQRALQIKLRRPGFETFSLSLDNKINVKLMHTHVKDTFVEKLP